MRSAELYLDAAKKAVARYQINNPNADFSGTKTCSISSDNINCTGIGPITVEVNGTKPTGGTIVLKDGKVAQGTEIKYQNETYAYNGSSLALKGTNNNDDDEVICTNGFQEKSFGNSCTYQDLDSIAGISVGDKVTCGTESFYVIETPTGDTVKMITEWNLNVTDPDAYTYNGISNSQLYTCSTEGYQDEHVRGYTDDDQYKKQVTYTYGGSGSGSGSYYGSGSYSGSYYGSGSYSGSYYGSNSENNSDVRFIPYGTVAFWSEAAADQVNYHDYGYWTNNDESLNLAFTDKQCTGDNCNYYNGIQYPVYVYGTSNSNNGAAATLTPFVTNYVNNLNSSLGTNATGRLITYDELTSLGCSNYSCSNSQYNWVYQTSYWSGSANDMNYVWYMRSDGEFNMYNSHSFRDDEQYGIRPVIEISKSVIQ